MQLRRKKDANNEVTYGVKNDLNAFNAFKCGRTLLDRLYVLYEIACMAIQSTMSNSTYFDSKEQVDAKSKLEELVDAIKNSEELVDAVSKAKAYRDYIIKNEFETMNVFEREIIRGVESILIVDSILRFSQLLIFR